MEQSTLNQYDYIGDLKRLFYTLTHPTEFLSQFTFDKHSINLIIDKILYLIEFILNYKVIYATNNRPITFVTILLSLTLFVFSLKLAKHISLISKRYFINRSVELDVSSAATLEKISYYGLILLFAILILDAFNIPITTFAIIGTTLAVGVGFGSQNIVNNFMSGILLLIESPIKLEDTIEVNGVKGRVLNIGVRCTQILTDNNMLVLIPNSTILQNTIINHTHDNDITKAILTIKLPSDLNLSDVEQSILEKINKSTQILKIPKPEIILKEIYNKEFTININFFFSSKNGYQEEKAISDLNRLLLPYLNKIL